MTKPTEKGKRFVRESEKNCFQIYFSAVTISLSLFSPIKISNESEIKFIFYLLFRWWFLSYIMWESSSFFRFLGNEGHDKRVREWKTCCLLLLSKILFVSWCQTIFIYSQHTLYYSAKIVQTLNLLPFQIAIQDNREWWKGL